MSFLLRPELRPFIIIIPMSRPFVMHLKIFMFNTSVIPNILLDQYLNPQFIHCTKYAKYAFLLLFSIHAYNRNAAIYRVKKLGRSIHVVHKNIQHGKGLTH